MTTSPKHLGKYELQMRLGQGGMAEVWKGFDPQLKRLVAIKFLHANLRSHPDFVNRFVREGQAIAALHHPNIVQVYDFQVSSSDDENPMAYMVMDYIEGSTLADYLQHTSYAGKFPSADEIVHLFASISQAIDYAHLQHMIHRDIKPANILLDIRNTVHNSMGEPILTDFGIVKMLGTAALTSTGISMGTPLYISPEQVHGQSGNEKSDIYGLGVILYEMCTGQPPYSGDNPYVILAQRISRLPDPPSQHNADVSPAVDAVILRCLAMDPEERFASASQLTVALAEAFMVPIPDMVRHTLLLPPLQTPLMPLPPLPPTSTMVDTSPGVSSTDPQLHPVGNSGPLIVGNETLLSDTGVTSLGDVKNGTSRETTHPAIHDADHALVSPVSGPATPPLIAAFAPKKRHRYFSMHARIILLAVVIGVSMIGGVYAFVRGTFSATPSPYPISVGSMIFLNSEQHNGQNIAALNDGIEVRLSPVPDPSAGRQYYAWLQENLGATTSIPLGALHVNQGSATLSYVDSQHRNLLALANSFLVTEQSVRALPDHLARDETHWRYLATIPHVPSHVDGLSYLDHLRHLLVSEPALERFQLHNGTDFWLLNSLQNLYTDAIALRTTSNPQEIHQHLASILLSLDGPCAHQEYKNISSGSMPKNALLAYQIPVLDCALGVNVPGYITHVAYDLDGMINAPEVSPQQVQRAKSVRYDLSAVRDQLQQIRIDVLQLTHLDDVHLIQSSSLLDTIVMHASDVVGGRFDPSTQTLLLGVGQICNEITFLASFTVSPYKAT